MGTNHVLGRRDLWASCFMPGAGTLAVGFLPWSAPEGSGAGGGSKKKKWIYDGGMTPGAPL